MNRLEFDDEWDVLFHGDEVGTGLGRERKKSVYALIIYDICDNKRRTQLAKLLSGYGKRVQRSGFEVRISEIKYRRLITQLPRFCAPEDSVRLYRIPEEHLVLTWGVDDSFLNQEDVIIM